MKKAKKRKSKIGTFIYWSFLLVWIALLAYASTYIWKDAKRFGEYWEAAQIEPKLNAYVDRLSVEMWQGGEISIQNTVSQMEHPYQTDEECMVVLKDILQGEMRTVPSTGLAKPGTKTYDLLCGNCKLGQITLVEQRFTPDEDWILNGLIEKYYLYPWEVDESSVQFGLDNLDGMYTSFEITVPEKYTVLLNGHPLTQEDIIETGIPYDVLVDYYDEFDGLPTKVTYHTDKIFGHVDYQLLDESGNPTVIDPEKDDSQFIAPVSDELVVRFERFARFFSYRYLAFSAGTRDMQTLWIELEPFLLRDSDLYDRCYRMIDSYWGWQHNKDFNFYGATLNSVTALGNDLYVLDVSTDSGSQMPAGYVKVHRDMKVYVRYYPNTDEVFAFAAEDYNAEES